MSSGSPLGILGSPGGINLHQYWSIFRRRWWVMAGVTAFVLVMGMVWTFRKPRIYQASASVIINPQAPKALGAQMADVVELGSGNYWSTQDYYNTQVRIIRSKTLARAVVQRNKLYDDARIVGALALGADEGTRVERAVDYLMAGTRVYPVKDSRVFGIAMRDTRPELAQELANKLAAEYIDQNVKYKIDTTKDAAHWVGSKVDEARLALARAETALHEYKRDNNILSVSLEDKQNETSRDMEKFSISLTDAKAKRIDLQVRRKAIANLMDNDALAAPSTYVAVSPSIDAARRNYLSEKSKLAQLDERYGHKHPEVIYQRSRLESAMSELRTEATGMERSMDAEIKALLDAESRYGAELDALKAQGFALNEKELKYRQLSRDAENAQKVYAELLGRLNDSGLQSQDQGNNIEPLDAAELPTAPVEPNLRSALVFSLFIGLLLAFATTALLEFADRSVKTQEDVERTLALPFLGIVPALAPGTSSADLHVHEHPASSIAECCRAVRTNLLFSSPDKPLRKLVVTSSNPVEGKTITVINLGTVLAQSGHRTLLVDTDMRRPRLHKAFGLPNDDGLSRLIVGETTLDAAVRTTVIPNLFLLPCGPIPPNPAELLQTEKFASIAKGLAEKFDRVVFDSPPVLAVTDSVILSQVSDGVVFVVRAGRTPREVVMRAKELLLGVKANVIGVVLNDVNLSSPHYQQYYRYYQYRYQPKAERPSAS